jgi:hypothetical protein
MDLVGAVRDSQRALPGPQLRERKVGGHAARAEIKAVQERLGGAPGGE